MRACHDKGVDHTQVRVVSFKSPRTDTLALIDLSHLGDWLRPDIVQTISCPAAYHMFIVGRKFSNTSLATC